MNVTYIRERDMKEYLKKNIATPYLKGNDTSSRPYDIGYCIIDASGVVDTKREVSCRYEEIVIHAKGIRVSVTKDGYVRFWHNNPNKYLSWVVNNEDKCIELRSKNVKER